jgi:hypothetical protein
VAATFKCDLCWIEFDNQLELDAHIAMENEVEWTIDGLEHAFDDDDEYEDA